MYIHSTTIYMRNGFYTHFGWAACARATRHENYCAIPWHSMPPLFDPGAKNPRRLPYVPEKNCHHFDIWLIDALDSTTKVRGLVLRPFCISRIQYWWIKTILFFFTRTVNCPITTILFLFLSVNIYKIWPKSYTEFFKRDFVFQ